MPSREKDFKHQEGRRCSARFKDVVDGPGLLFAVLRCTSRQHDLCQSMPDSRSMKGAMVFFMTVRRVCQVLTAGVRLVDEILCKH